MKTKITYKGTKDGVFGVYCGFKPEGLAVSEEITVYYPDDGKIFKKDGEEYPNVILGENENIEDYEEVEYDDNNAN